MWEPSFLQGMVWIMWPAVMVLLWFIWPEIKAMWTREDDEEFYIDEAGTEWPFPASDVEEQDGS